MTDFYPERFYASGRDLAMSDTTALTKEYIARLEAIARAAIDYWLVTGQETPTQLRNGIALYDALMRVNFLDDELITVTQELVKENHAKNGPS